MVELIKNSKLGIGVIVGVVIGTLIGGEPLGGAFIAGAVIGVIAIIVENMIAKR